jgi:SAM-dependent methyltransferase
MATATVTATARQSLDEVVQKLFADLSAGYGGVMVSVGHKLGLYKAMAGQGPLSSHEVASRAGCAERYVREWLNSQAAGGYVDYHPASGTYELTAEQALVLADDKSPVFLCHAWQIVASMWADEPKTLNSFRTGAGLPWGDHDDRLYCGIGAFYRNCYSSSLIQEWLPALDGVVEKLERGVRVADIGCGYGHSTVLMAEAYPESLFWGFDGHAGSIEAAREIAAESGVQDRAFFDVAAADSYPGRNYDLICFFDCLHDMGRPLAAIEYAKRALAADGTLIVIEPFASDRVEENANPVGRLYYAGSTTMCCAHAISENGTHVLGAQAGLKRLTEIFHKAGFRHVRKAAQTPFNLIIEVRR